MAVAASVAETVAAGSAVPVETVGTAAVRTAQVVVGTEEQDAGTADTACWGHSFASAGLGRTAAGVPWTCYLSVLTCVYDAHPRERVKQCY